MSAHGHHAINLSKCICSNLLNFASNMISTTILMLIVVGMTSWLYAGLFLVLTIENRRYWKRSLQLKTPTGDNHPRVCVMVPCKGIDPDMKRNLGSFLQQDHPNFRVLFIVESGHDPAVHLIQQVIREHPFAEAKAMVAGPAINRGQKVHNLCQAVDSLEDEIDIYAFADCDAASGSTWLRWLVDCIGREGVGARTGYRWMKPGNKSLPTLLACTANNTLAAMMGRGGHHLIWGGSWAIHRSIFRATGIRQAWEGVVSDDLASSRALKLAKLKILFDPQCLCSTTVKYTWSSLFEFYRRQLLITRRHAPVYWTVGLLTTVAVQIAFWGGIAATVSANRADNLFWSALFGYTAIGLYLVSIIRAAIRQNMGRRADSMWRNEKAARYFDLFASPLTGLFVLAAFLSSCLGNTITWRGNHYHLGPGGAGRLLGKAIGSQWPVGLEEQLNIAATIKTDQPHAAPNPKFTNHQESGPAVYRPTRRDVA